MEFPPRILLIDDDCAWLEALSEYLLRKGFSVVAVNDPREAFAVLEGHDVSLIVCDFDMPGMNGLHLIRRLQRLPRKLTVLMLSNEDEPTLPTRSQASGAMAFLGKTTAPALLLRMIRQLVRAARPLAMAPPALQLWQRLLPPPRRDGSNNGHDPLNNSARNKTTQKPTKNSA